MRYPVWKRLSALLLCFCLILPQLPAAAAAEEQSGFLIEAEGPELTVFAPNSVDLFTDSAKTGVTATIARDFDQTVRVALRNQTSAPVTYYMTVDNPNDDLSMNFVGSGFSQETAVTLAPWSGGSAELAVFAQDAKASQYDNIKLTCHTVDGGAVDRMLHLAVTGEGMDLAITNSEESTGDLTVTVQNNGNDINSLIVDVDEDLASYAYFPTVINQTTLKRGDSISFKVVPMFPDDSLDSVSGNLIFTGSGDTEEYPITLRNVHTDTLSGSQLTEEALFANSAIPGYLSPEEDAAPELTVDRDSLTASYSMVHEDKETGKVTELPVKITFSRTEEACPEDTPNILDDNAIWHGTQISEASVDGDTLKITMKRWTEATGAASLMDESDPVTSFLNQFDIEIDLSQLPDDKRDQLVSDYSKAVEDIDKGEKYIADQYPGMSDERKAEQIAYVQLSILIDLLNEKDENGEYKYPEARKQFEDGLREMGYGPEDPIADLENTLNHDSLVQEAKKKVIEDKIIMDEENKNKDTDEKQEEIDDNGKNSGSEITIEEETNQCTNRGKITTSFHGKDYVGNRSRAAGVTAADKGVRVFYTGRIVSKDKYISFEPVEYDLYLNGEHIGESKNSGLSEMNIIELDANKVLLGEKNTFTRDYRVNPGTHFVTTDNRYTLVYPADARLKVTDASLVQPARADFDIYEKNIFAINADGEYVEEPISGGNTIHVSVSNRGSRAGFYRLTITDTEGNILMNDEDDDKYRYLPAFTAETLELENVRLEAGTNNITVTMTDCSPYLPAKESIVSASGEITARAREIPVIASISPANGMDVSSATMLSASLNNYRDVEKAAFYLDGAAEPVGAVEGASGQYNVSLPAGLEPGAHTVRVVVSYYTGGPADTATAEVEGTAAFTVTPPPEPEYHAWAEVILPEGTAQPVQYRLIRYNEVSERYTSFGEGLYSVVQADGKNSLRLRDNGEYTLNPEGAILTAFDSTNGKLYAGTVGAQGTAVTLSAGRTLTVQNASFASNYVNAYIPGIGGNYRITAARGQNTVALPALRLQVRASLQYGGASGVSVSLNETMDFTKADQEYDAAALVRTYTFKVPDDAGMMNVSYLYKSDSDYYDSDYMTTRLEGTTLTAYLTRVRPNTTSEYIQLVTTGYAGENQNRKQAYLLFVNLTDYKAGMDLGTLPMKKLSFTADNPEKLEVNHISMIDNRTNMDASIPMYAYNGTVLCTPGDYTAYVSFLYDGINHNVSKTIDLSSADQVIDLYDEPPMGTLTVSWPQELGTRAYVYLDKSGDSISVDAENGTAQPVPAGSYHNAYITIYPDEQTNERSYHFDTGSPLNIKAGKNGEITIGDTFTGNLELTNDYGQIHTVGSNVQMRLDDLKDASGNSLSDYQGNLSGCVVFTPKDGEGEGAFAVPVTLGNLSSSFSVLLARAGSYTTKFTTDPKAAGLTAAVITANAGTGGSISPSGKVSVVFGGSQSFRISASSGYRIDHVLVDGSSIGAVSEYTFENVSGNHTIEAVFTALTDEDPKPVEGDSEEEEDEELYHRPKRSKGEDNSASSSTEKPKQEQPSATGEDINLTITPNVSDDGQASYKMDSEEAGSLADSARQNNSERVNLNVRSDKDFDRFDLSIPAKEAQRLASQSSAELNLLTPIGSLKLSNTALGTLANRCSDLLGMSIQKTADSITLAVQADGHNADALPGMAASVPLGSAAGSGAVAFRVNADGSETLLKKSYVDGNALQVRLDGSAAVRIRDNSKVFGDTAGHWAKDAIDFVSSRDLFQGTSDGSFSPDMPMTRAMLVAVLHRLEDTPAGGNAPFSDVTAGEWYAAAVSWASGAGIVSGSGGRFQPGSHITREQLAVILYQYAGKIGMDTSARADLNRFPDAGQVSSWASEAMQWAVSAGLISGTSQGTLNPGGNASRSEVASMLMRLVQQIV